MENDEVIFLAKDKNDEVSVYSTDRKSTKCLSSHYNITDSGKIAFNRWMDKFTNTMDNKNLVFDEASCLRESLLLAEELKELMERYSIKEDADER